MNKPKLTSPLVHIGATAEAIMATRGAIMEILVSQNSEKVKEEALLTLRTICEVKDTTITNCNIGVMSGMPDARR